MKKNIFFAIHILLGIFSLTSCSSTMQEPVDTRIDIDTVQETIDTQTEIETTEYHNSENITPNDTETDNIHEEKTYAGREREIMESYTFDYTFFPASLMEYIGRDDFYAWIDSTEPFCLDEDDNWVPVNIIDCINYFKIPQAEFEKLHYAYNYYTLVYDIDLMYNGTAEEIREYFMNHEKRAEEIDRKLSIWTAKTSFCYDTEKWTSDEAIIEKYKNLPLTAWTFADIIYEANIPRADVEAILADNEIFTAEVFDKIYEAVNARKNGTLERGSAMELQMFGGGNTDVENCKRVVEAEMELLYPAETGSNAAVK